MIIDIIIIVIISLSVIIGMLRGFANTIIGLVSVILSIIIAFFLCNPTANLLCKITDIDENVYNRVVTIIPMHNDDIEIDVNTNSVPEMVQNAIDNTVTEAQSGINKKKNELINSAATSMTRTIMNAIAFVGLFIVVRLILFGLKLITEIAKQQDFVEKVDRTMGFIFGLIRGILIVYVAFGVIKVCEVMIKNDTIYENIEQSTIGSYIYNHNFMATEIKDISKKD